MNISHSKLVNILAHGLCLLAVVVALAAAETVVAQETKLLLLGSSSIPGSVRTSRGITLIPPTSWDDGEDEPIYYQPANGQIIVPRFANGSGHPAGAVYGWGPTSVIEATSETDNQTVPAIVITEGADSSSTAPVYGAEFRDFLMFGDPDDPNHNTANTSYGGMKIRTYNANVENVKASYIPGIGFDLDGTSSTTQADNYLPFEGTMLRVWNCRSHASNQGFNINRVDAQVGRLEVAGWYSAEESYAVSFPVGACQIDGTLHLYGGGAQGVALYFPTTCHDMKCAAPLYLENCGRGLWIKGNYNHLTGSIRSFGCAITCVDVDGTNNRIDGFYLKGSHASCEYVMSIDNAFNTILNGRIELSHANCDKGIVLTGNAKNHTVIERVDIYNTSGAAATGKYAISVETSQAINDAAIDIHIGGFEYGIDLFPGGVSKLGQRNRINITVDTGGAVTTPVNLPTTWDDDSNEIRVNGVLQTDT